MILLLTFNCSKWSVCGGICRIMDKDVTPALKSASLTKTEKKPMYWYQSNKMILKFDFNVIFMFNYPIFRHWYTRVHATIWNATIWYMYLQSKLSRGFVEGTLPASVIAMLEGSAFLYSSTEKNFVAINPWV